MHIVIIGGGIGGLCLAQGLKKHGIDATVYDRDPSARFHDQGWRLTIKEEGDRALRECLTEELYQEVRAGAIRPATRLAFMDHLLNPKFVKPVPQVPGHFGVRRQLLRQTLLKGLDVRFGKTFVRYEGATAHFADGTTASGDLIVGADGTFSAVRRQLVPGAELEDLGSAIYGVTPFTTLDEVPDLLVDTFNRITGPHGAAMAVATCRPGDYFTWTLSGGASPAQARDLVAGWHPAVRRIVAEATTAFMVQIRSALPYEPWDDPHVTLLGDAAHTMTPGRGDGANTALRDALLLTRTLAAGGPVRAYEEEMLRYGFAAVAASRDMPFAPRHGFRSSASAH
ncbi:FAD-dependent oxidoreductase [Thermoactinospora rubra]|uniref:FAD-dependent oxidoreductase n=1 Tax=Thermoactinospora rubra TaxID=1088767 RepID=UPI000A10B17A|nr:FAD-dependent monooxygenase [Thermoactinospora rubra]